MRTMHPAIIIAMTDPTAAPTAAKDWLGIGEGVTAWEGEKNFFLLIYIL